MNVINILKEDSALAALLGTTEADSCIYPFFSDEVKDCFVYSYSDVSADGVKRTRKLELTAISRSYKKALEMQGRAQALLITLGDAPLLPDVLKVVLNGGGSLYNEVTETYHVKGYFYLTERVK